MPTDAQLLLRYVKGKDEAAFAGLVQRHLALVYGAALRRTSGRAVLAEEIAQKVFADLAQKASSLTHHPTLAGWLHQATRFTAIDALRAEARRQRLAQVLANMPDHATEPNEAPDWEHLRPVLDEALDQLKPHDRDAVLLRHFQGLSHAEVGMRLGVNENTARMRAERALDKLRAHLGRRGVTSTAAALGLLLANQTLTAAPASLKATIVHQAMATAVLTGVPGAASYFLMSKLAIPFASGAIAAALTALVWTSVTPMGSADELTSLRQENARLAQTVVLAAEVRAAQATAITQAMARKRAGRAGASMAASPVGDTRAGTADVTSRHRNRGQATPRDAFLSLAWAGDAGEVDALAKLIAFDERGRQQALVVLASMPESLRTQYPTPEELYAFFFAADALVAPPPGADVLESFVTVELSPGRVALRFPGSAQNFQEYLQTPEGWKWLVPEDGIEHAPQVLSNETLAKLGTP